jgi:hypothetical protein
VTSALSFLSVFVLLLFVHARAAPLLNAADIRNTLLSLGVLPALQRSAEDFQVWKTLRFDRQTPPDCPMSNEFFACNETGHLVTLNVTVRQQVCSLTLDHFGLADETTLDGFEGFVLVSRLRFPCAIPFSTI